MANEPTTNWISKTLSKIRGKIENLHIPTSVFCAIGITDSEYIIAIINEDNTTVIQENHSSKHPHDTVIEWLNTYSHEHNVKIIASCILDGEKAKSLASRLWLELDIIPYPSNETSINEEIVTQSAQELCKKFDANNLVKISVSTAGEVGISFLTILDEYKKTTTEHAWKILETQTEEFKNTQNNILFINATAQGGGVALMRHALMRFYRLLGVNAHWHALKVNKAVFEITKTKFHNILQNVAPENVELTQEDVELYNAWCKENTSIMAQAIKDAHVIVIDDPQPSGMIPHIQAINKDVKIIYRSHIHLNKDTLDIPNTPQNKTWKFIWNNAQKADIFISHPVPAFIPNSALEKTVTMPATTDPLDGLNKPLSKEQIAYYINLFNKILLEHDQTMLDKAREYIIQIARFDPSKGIPDVIESYRKFRELYNNDKKVPQLVIVGHGSIDDPDGIPVYNMTTHLLQQETYQQLASDVKVIRLHHNDQILNALLRASKVALQLSLREGFEVKVSEALHKGIPVIAYRAGGIPLQIEHGITGFLVEINNTDKVAEHLYELFTDTSAYNAMSASAKTTVKPDFFTTYNAIKWLELANKLKKGEAIHTKGAPAQIKN